MTRRKSQPGAFSPEWWAGLGAYFDAVDAAAAERGEPVPETYDVLKPETWPTPAEADE